MNEARDGAQRRRLPGAVRAEQGDNLALVDAEVDIADDRGALVAGGQALDREDGHVATPAVPRYAPMTLGSRRTSSGVPCPITWPNSNTTM